jgi:hypothetical protein
MAESMQNSARGQAVLWALDQLESLMGPDWLERYFDKAGHVPEDVNLGAGHVAATGHLLDMALRYYIHDGCHGIAKVRNLMRADLQDERRWHCGLQLEVGALAARAGFTVALEAAAPPPAGLADVSLCP